MPIPLKLYRYLRNGMKMCISFGYNPQVIFVIFSQVELIHFIAKQNGIKEFGLAAPPTVLCHFL